MLPAERELHTPEPALLRTIIFLAAAIAAAAAAGLAGNGPFYSQTDINYCRGDDDKHENISHVETSLAC